MANIQLFKTNEIATQQMNELFENRSKDLIKKALDTNTTLKEKFENLDSKNLDTIATFNKNATFFTKSYIAYNDKNFPKTSASELNISRTYKSDLLLVGKWVSFENEKINFMGIENIYCITENAKTLASLVKDFEINPLTNEQIISLMNMSKRDLHSYLDSIGNDITKITLDTNEQQEMIKAQKKVTREINKEVKEQIENELRENIENELRENIEKEYKAIYGNVKSIVDMNVNELLEQLQAISKQLFNMGFNVENVKNAIDEIVK